MMMCAKVYLLLQDGFPDDSTYKYQFRETSSSSHPSVVKKVKKSDYADQRYEGDLLASY